MQVKEIMSANPAMCTSESSLQEVASLMVEHDCGAIPVCGDSSRKEPVGIVTDRDITCRVVAEGKNPLELKVKDAMTPSPVTVREDDDVQACVQVLEQHQLRRVPVVDGGGSCCGIVAQADIARQTSEHDAAEVVRTVSQPTGAAAH